MSMQENREKAMRLFEALSAVDEELLARTEEGKKVIPFRRATKVMASCACILMVGVVTWMGSRTLFPKENAASDCAAPESLNQMMTDTTADMTADAEEVLEEAAVEMASEGAEDEKVMEDKEVYDFVNQESLHEEDAASGTAVKSEMVKYDSEKELRERTNLGEYIPTMIPEGYLFESGYESTDGGIHLCWSKGMDTIMIDVAVYESDEESEGRIVDITKPETYDEQMYVIPYASTVPEEYHQSFQNPIFREADFTEEVVLARMKQVVDMGDTNTPRGRFSVLYENGVMVSFNGDCDAVSVWEMFESIGK